MKKRKSQLAVVVPVVTVIVLFFLYVTMVYPSLEQNRTIRRFISEQVLENMQQQKVHTLTEIYKPASLPFWYAAQIRRSTLLGWKIISVDSQPYPMDTGDNRVTVKLVLYYHLPSDVMQPQGPYTEGNFPPYGKCTEYRASCHLYWSKDQRRFMLNGPNFLPKKMS